MKISRIFAHRVELPLVEGCYKWSGGKSVSIFDSTIVGVETDCGVVGYGEVCPLGSFYLPAYAEGVRAGLREISPHLIGVDPLELSKPNLRCRCLLIHKDYLSSKLIAIDFRQYTASSPPSTLPRTNTLARKNDEAISLLF